MQLTKRQIDKHFEKAYFKFGDIFELEIEEQVEMLLELVEKE